MYDERGSPIGMQCRTKNYAEGAFDTYYFEKNLQGDIIAVYDASGTKLISYTYDAWGVHTVTNHVQNVGAAQYNPFRYRGYYYDADLEFYYLNSRYYDPYNGRFINADGVLNGGVGLTSYNQFAYCSNNPVMNIDPSGNFAISIKTIIIVSVAIFSAIALAATINDIYQISSGNVSAETTSSVDNGDSIDNVHVTDSYKIITPWMQYGYSFYLNYINEMYGKNYLNQFKKQI